MRKPVLTIFYQFNPWNTTIGGIQTLIKNFIKYAPSEFEVRLVGTASCFAPTGGDRYQLVGKWQEAELAGRAINFLPLFPLENDNIRHFVPTTLKYTAALLGRCFASDFMHFHRLEPTLAALKWRGEKTLFVHTDVQTILTKTQATDNKKVILWQSFPAAYFALEKLLVGQFNQILSCNINSSELYRQRYPNIAKRVADIKNSFDGEIFYPLNHKQREVSRCEVATSLGLNPDTRFILFAGRLHPHKDPILLVRAIAALNDPKVHLLIAGDGELAPEVRAEISQLELSDRITLLGAIPQEKLAQLHRICNAFVLSSVTEGLPLVALEALASGTPVVTTRCGETPKLLTSDSGVVCEERTPQCIANALRKVLLHPENYPTESCVRTAQPYAASTVVNEVYNQMWQRWEQRNHSAVV
ncbi:glycosyltransferase family 4 protein [Chlorogloeopsis fritschii PCC 9212]|uniref:Glycosyl transferase n=1 Tax=Chlorogloeopsis fritschii PCC 6912 TaxID=211165 RepID=A0A433NJZ5_CHLFR|nr:glycosyltransferase family 4 protein [Chlorogloeopsis fritschii]RUR83023.1 glycosyl transferase [Chlorogloeopsis fritschii PCC 6912]